MVTTEMVQRAQKFAWATNVENLIHVPGIGFLYKPHTHNEWLYIDAETVDNLVPHAAWRHMEPCLCEMCIA